MGIYLNPSNAGFKKTLAGNIFVDKSMLISELNKFIDSGNQYVCVSRPRRFGKTIATNMMCAYYSKGCDSREIFSKMKISKAKNYEQQQTEFDCDRRCKRISKCKCKRQYACRTY